MAAHGWGSSPDLTLEETLFTEGHRFDFFQAVAVLEALHKGAHDAASVAEGMDPRREAVRFQSAVGLGFPPGDIVRVRRGADGAPAWMTVAFMSLVGAMGPMPEPLSELVMRSAVQRDLAPADFLDIFHHRLVSLRFRVRRLHRIALGARAMDASRAAAHLFATMGMLAPATGEDAADTLRSRQRAGGRPLLHYAGLFATEVRSLAGLTSMLRHRFGMPIRAIPLTGSFRALDASDRTAIGARGRNRSVGDRAVLGRRVWDQQGAFEICVGRSDDPDQGLTRGQLLGFLPGTRGVAPGSTLAPFAELVRTYVGPSVDFTLRLAVEPQSAPQAALGRSPSDRLRAASPPASPPADAPRPAPEALVANTGNSPRLGYTAWLGRRRPIPSALEIRVSGRSLAVNDTAPT